MSFSKSLFLTVLAITVVASPASGANGRQSPNQNQKDSPQGKQDGKQQQLSGNQMMHWLTHSCHHLVTLIHTKSKVIKKLEQSIQKVRNEKDLTAEMRAFQIHTFEIFKKELNESENSIFTSIGSLKRALTVSQPFKFVRTAERFCTNIVQLCNQFNKFTSEEAEFILVLSVKVSE